MNPSQLLGKDIASYLAKNLKENGALWDEVDGKPSPSDHYAQAFFALASLRLSSLEKDPVWEKRGERALEHYFSFSPSSRGHLEFNQLGLLLCLRELRAGKNRELEGRLEGFLRKLPFSTSPGSNHANNWLAIRLVAEALRGKLLGENTAEKEKGLLTFLLGTQLPDGFFYDYPPVPGAKSVAVPLTYHAKTCCMLLLYHLETGSQEAKTAALRGLGVLKELIAPDGSCLYFGRSANSLFGYAAGILAFSQAASLLQRENPPEASSFGAAAARLLAYLQGWQEPDGSIPIVPGVEKEGWDFYMHHSVYNAFASAFFLLCPDVPGKGVLPQKDFFYAPDSGFLALRGKGTFLALQVQGQHVPGNMCLFNDARYYGMQVLGWWQDGKELVPFPTLALSDKKNIFPPSRNGFLPAVRLQGKEYGARGFEGAQVFRDKEKGFLLAHGTGQLGAYFFPPFLVRLPLRLWNKGVRGKRMDYLEQTLSARLERHLWFFPGEQALITADRVLGLESRRYDFISPLRLSLPSVSLGKTGGTGIMEGAPIQFGFFGEKRIPSLRENPLPGKTSGKKVQALFENCAGDAWFFSYLQAAGKKPGFSWDAEKKCLQFVSEETGTRHFLFPDDNKGGKNP